MTGSVRVRKPKQFTAWVKRDLNETTLTLPNGDTVRVMFYSDVSELDLSFLTKVTEVAA